MKFDLDFSKTYSMVDLTLGDDSTSVRGGYGNLNLVLSSGNHLVVAGSGYTTAYLGAHKEKIFKTHEYTTDDGVVHEVSYDYDSYTFDGWGDSIFIGGDGGSSVVSSFGNDTLIGGRGRDELFAGDGDNLVKGKGGADTIVFGAGNSQGYGGNGADWLFAGSGKQLLSGGRGSDHLVGGAGTTMTGGRGPDFFNFTWDQGSGKAKVTDFNTTQGDVIDLTQLGRYQDLNEEDEMYSLDLDRDNITFDVMGRMHINDDALNQHLVIKGLEALINDQQSLDTAIDNGWVVVHEDFFGGKG